MDHIKQKVKCPHCDNGLDLVISEFGGKVVVEPPEASPYVDKKELIDFYKKTKGFTDAAGVAWDREHRARAFHHAKKILAAIPVVDTAKRAISWTADEWRRRGLGKGNEWNLGTVEKWVAEFLVDERKRKTLTARPKCVGCMTAPAEEGALVCEKCAWCWKCDDAGRPSGKNPVDMVYGGLTAPVCRSCAAGEK